MKDINCDYYKKIILQVSLQHCVEITNYKPDKDYKFENEIKKE